MNLDSVYTELIMEHNKSKRNRRNLERCNMKYKGVNPSCGDEIELEFLVEDGIIKDVSYTGQGCAISQASTSIMIDLIKGKTVQEALELGDVFIGMIKKEDIDEEKLMELEDALAFQNISNMPARVKCAVLGWHTLKQLKGEK